MFCLKTHLATKFEKKSKYNDNNNNWKRGNCELEGKVGDDFRAIKRFVDVSVYLTACNLSQAENAFPSEYY